MFKSVSSRQQIFPATSTNLSRKKASALSGFEWSLKPIIIWLKLLTGIKFNLTGKESTTSSISLTIYGVTVLLLNAILSAFFVGGYMKQRTIKAGVPAFSPMMPSANDTSFNNNNITPTEAPSHENDIFSYAYSAYSDISFDINLMTIVFVYLQEFVYISGIHLCFFVSQNRLKGLWKSLLIIEKEFKIPFESFNRIRKTDWIGIFLLLLNCAAYALYIKLKSLNNVDYNNRMIAIILSILSQVQVFPVTIVILIWILVRTTSIIFSVLKQRMKKILKQDKMSIELDEVRTWKLQHGLICSLIKRINNCFGTVNLIIMVHTFITFIYNIYQFVNCMKNHQIPPSFYAYKFILQASLPCFLIYSCSQLQEQSSKIAEILHNVDVYTRGGNSEVQIMVNALFLQVIQANANISASGIFNLDFTLFPTLIGTTLTYVVILVSAV